MPRPPSWTTRTGLLAALLAAACAAEPGQPPAPPPADTTVDFRAVGQEPGWLVEIADGHQIKVLADYGERNFTFPAPPPESAAGRRTYQ